MDEYITLVENIEKATGLSLTSDELLNYLKKYADYIIYWNGFTNLTSLVHLDDIFVLHFYDSYTPLYFWQKQWKTVYDVGTGAGLPGIPLALLFRKIKFVLVESNKKKCYLLENLKNIFKMNNIEIINDRAENINSVDGDCVLTRAVSRLDIVLEITCRLLKKGGHNLLMRGGEYIKEIQLSKQRAAKMNYELVKYAEVVDSLDRITSLVLYKLLNKPPEIFPRRFPKIKRRDNG